MKALIIEDDKILSNNICESLKHRFDMTQALDGDEGLRRAKESYQPDFMYERYAAVERNEG